MKPGKTNSNWILSAIAILVVSWDCLATSPYFRRYSPCPAVLDVMVGDGSEGVAPIERGQRNQIETANVVGAMHNLALHEAAILNHDYSNTPGIDPRKAETVRSLEVEWVNLRRAFLAIDETASTAPEIHERNQALIRFETVDRRLRDVFPNNYRDNRRPRPKPIDSSLLNSDVEPTEAKLSLWSRILSGNRASQRDTAADKERRETPNKVAPLPEEKKPTEEPYVDPRPWDERDDYEVDWTVLFFGRRR